ncbi:ABC transporter ATP-binding protein [Psychrobacillus sp. INOP01]|uniref:ABC transporter ATP-binding protein n=1 Tax=Psychrobacillus sp. INOP01 TaxID=2829187 RepID=UPI001BA9AA5F|nr:ABC transporter ATP-binding protein [Psychrobacillus sp. INOP01]QUG43120.1 ABC transporter ATP-binding protein [Psychrobacillus sp. INOP01]
MRLPNNLGLSNYKIFSRLFKLIWKNKKRPFIIWMTIIIVSSGFPALQIMLQKLSVDSIASLNKEVQTIYYIFFIISLMYISIFVSSILNEIASFLSLLIKEDIDFKLKTALIEKTIDLPMSEFESAEMYNRVSLAKEAVNQNPIELINKFFTLGQKILSLLGIMVLVTVIHWSMPIILICSSLPGVILLLIMKKKRYKLSVNTTEYSRAMDYSYRLMLKRESAKEIRIFNLQHYLVSKWASLFQTVRNLLVKQYKRESFTRILAMFFLQITAVTAAFVIVLQISKGDLTVGDYVALMGSVIMIQSTLGGIGEDLGGIFESFLYSRNLFNFLDDENNQKRNTKLKQYPSEGFSSLRVENLSFKYSHEERYVLKNLNFEIKKGETIAIVGENGAGKTTLINCLLGLYSPTQGSIKLDNLNINDIDPGAFKKNVSVVFQDFIKYAYTLRENVAFGNLEKMSDTETIKKMLRKVNLLDILEQLSKNIDTTLGREFQGGQELSGGQWQRIAIARAFLKDAEILVFDEPTSALDPNAELEIFNCFEELAKGKTSFMISHRLGPTRSADKIIVLEKGKIVEQGSYDELMEKDGTYAKMYRKQSKWYENTNKNIELLI